MDSGRDGVQRSFLLTKGKRKAQPRARPTSTTGAFLTSTLDPHRPHAAALHLYYRHYYSRCIRYHSLDAPTKAPRSPWRLTGTNFPKPDETIQNRNLLSRR